MATPLPESPTTSPPGAASLDLTLTRIQTPTPAGGCVAKYSVGVSGVAADVWPTGGSFGMVYLQLTTSAQFWNSVNEAVPISYFKEYLFYNEGTFTGIPITVPFDYTAREIHIYTGSILSEPVSPSDVGLVNTDYTSAEVGVTPYFRQLQLPSSITITANLFRIYGALDNFIWVLTHSESFDLAAADGCPGSGGGGGGEESDPCGCGTWQRRPGGADDWAQRLGACGTSWSPRALGSSSWQRRRC